jgi:hypothetical protein
MKNGKVLTLIGAALFTGAACLLAASAQAGSCCGGGSAASLVLPQYARQMIDLSADVEKYHGFWNQDGKYTPDPPGSDLRQYRLNLGYATRLAPRWQTSIIVPYVWNDNKYSGHSSHSEGPGDTTLNLWYGAREDKSAWKIRSAKDLTPAVTIGPSLLIPTGISPYDSVNSSFDVTGRGFYRLDGNILVEKTIHPWSASLAMSYGTYLSRPVDREYGKYVEPYRRKLGDRMSGSLSLGYIYYLGTGGDTLTGTASLSYLAEADGKIDGAADPTSGFRKEAAGAALSYSNLDRDWSLRASWSHAIRQDGWGENFPTTDIFTLGVRYAFR